MTKKLFPALVYFNSPKTMEMFSEERKCHVDRQKEDLEKQAENLEMTLVGEPIYITACCVVHFPSSASRKEGLAKLAQMPSVKEAHEIFVPQD